MGNDSSGGAVGLAVGANVGLADGIDVLLTVALGDGAAVGVKV